MIRERALQVLLVLSGLVCLTGLYPLTGALRDGVASTINRQDQMILGSYVSLGVFLLIAARNPLQHRSLILFAGWSTLAHDSVMIVQGIRYHDLRSDLPGYAIARCHRSHSHRLDSGKAGATLNCRRLAPLPLNRSTVDKSRSHSLPRESLAVLQRVSWGESALNC
jgi:hypothetical protein